MKTKTIWMSVVIALAGIAGVVSSAQADMIFSLNKAEANLGPAPYGKVTLQAGIDLAGKNDVIVTVDLFPSYFYANTGNANSHTPFVFNLGSLATSKVTLDPASTFFTVLPSNVGPFTNTPYGTFNSGIGMASGVKNGATGVNQQLKFTVTTTSAANGIQFSDFIASTGVNAGNFFSADLAGLTTGNVASSAGLNVPNGGPPLPEPATIALLSLGLMGLGFAARRKSM